MGVALHGNIACISQNMYPVYATVHAFSEFIDFHYFFLLILIIIFVINQPSMRFAHRLNTFALNSTMFRWLWLFFVWSFNFLFVVRLYDFVLRNIIYTNLVFLLRWIQLDIKSIWSIVLKSSLNYNDKVLKW